MVVDGGSKANEAGKGNILMFSKNTPGEQKENKVNQDEQCKVVELLIRYGSDFVKKNEGGYTPLGLMRTHHFEELLSGINKRMEASDTPQRMTDIHKEIVWQLETAIENCLCPVDDSNRKEIAEKTSTLASIIERYKMQYQEKLEEKFTNKDLDQLSIEEPIEQAEKQKDTLASLAYNQKAPSVIECGSSNISQYEPTIGGEVSFHSSTHSE
ncbi:hypothetical protein [Candidatus Tisiphia endosymbiont of Nemotelus uliginosus]|uniref:hypothetical protein n=1 Tax=Candidatus Tisiphia endosymbiont of Nemotelus uliginosus TaxID=3077926 RepID=UPI0035C8D276